ncbi:MAG TPA: SHOCT domain-containing protein [Opitutaceae bacterium]
MLSGLVAGSLALSPAARADEDVVPMGNDTYTITCEAKSAFSRNADKLKDKAGEEAQKFCQAQGKQLKVLSVSANVPTFGLGYAKAKITFMALAANDPRLSAPQPPAPGVYGAPTYAAQPAAYAPPPPAYAPPPAAYAPPPAVAASPAAPPAQLSTDELYAELVKLDDLRKKNILTDEEFQAQKKKLLDRSN